MVDKVRKSLQFEKQKKGLRGLVGR